MLRFCLCFLSFFYTVNSFSTEKKQEEEIKCYSCKKTIIKIEKEKNNKENYTAEAPFASLSCIFDCNCNSYFLCKDCYEKKKKKKMTKCPKCKKKCNNENNEFENNENNENDDYQYKACSICYKAYIKTSPLGTYSFFYNCTCKEFICKVCYEKCIDMGNSKCPSCRHNKNEENKFDAMNEENKIKEEQKNCCQMWIGCIENCIIDCIYPPQ